MKYSSYKSINNLKNNFNYSDKIKKTKEFKLLMDKFKNLTFLKTKFKINKYLDPTLILNNIYNKNQEYVLFQSFKLTGKKQNYSFICANPFLIFKTKNYNTRIIIKNYYSTKKDYSLEFENQINPFDLLENLIFLFQKKFNKFLNENTFSGGAIGYIGFESIKYIEKIPDLILKSSQFDDIYLIFPSEIILFNNKKHLIELIVYGSDRTKIKNSLNFLQNKITKLINNNSIKKSKIYPKNAYRFNMSETNTLNNTNISGNNYNKNKETKREVKLILLKNLFKNFKSISHNYQRFTHIVKKAKEYIKKGEIFQVVLSHQIKKQIKENPIKIYQKLINENPSPYMYFIKCENTYIISSSPEILIKIEKVKNKYIAISKPIAGTRKRGKTKKIDTKIKKELLNDEKELAEHSMLVDLARNDLGKVCRYGSVRVKNLMKVEKFSKVMHIVSTITGEIQNNISQIELFKATFPAGTVSGAPKIRAIEIIEELENIKRGIYAGGIGYFNFNGTMDFCIAIRTIFIKNKTAYIQAGAGIVYDSDPVKEFNETINKLEALLNIL